MADSLSANTQEQMRALCHKISVAHALDPDIQEELYGHMEDKLLAYLKGEEQVTEQDAFILVREHFGDPAVVKGLLQGVHAHAVHASLARRLAAAFVVSIVLLIAASALHALIRTCAAVWAPSSFSSAVYSLQFQFTELTLAAGAVVIMWIVLRRWQRQLDAGRSTWFMSWSPVSLAALITVLLLIYGLGPSVLVDPGLSHAQTTQWLKVLPVLLALACCVPAAQCLVWLRWCDRVPRRTMTVAYGFAAWYIVRILPSLRRLPFPRLCLCVADTSTALASHPRSLAHGHITRSSLDWHLVAGHPRLSVTFANFYSHLPFIAWRAVVLGAAALILYVLVQRVWRRNGRLHPTGITGASHG